MNGISPELDRAIADMIRNHPAQQKAAAISAQAQQSIARTNAAVEAASKIRPNQEALDNAAQASAKAKAIAADTNARLQRLSEATAAAAAIKISFK